MPYRLAGDLGDSRSSSAFGSISGAHESLGAVSVYDYEMLIPTNVPRSANTASPDQMVTGKEELEEDVEKAEPPEPSKCVLTFFPGANSSTSSPAL